MNEQSLEEERMMREREAYDGPGPYVPWPSPPRSANNESQEGLAFIPATVLVFKDRHKQEIRNYAIFGQTLWNFVPQRIEKISLHDLDLDATIKANDERGLLFRIPSARQSSSAATPLRNNT